jgi:membrane protein implicated in regulation of membrane protease activity
MLLLSAATLLLLLLLLVLVLVLLLRAAAAALGASLALAAVFAAELQVFACLPLRPSSHLVARQQRAQTLPSRSPACSVRRSWKRSHRRPRGPC